MKYGIGVLLVLLGLSALGLSLAMRSQFNAAVQHANPNLDDYPLIAPLVPEIGPENAAAADELAEGIWSWIYAVGSIGLVLVVAGVTLIVTGRQNQSLNADEDLFAPESRQ